MKKLAAMLAIGLLSLFSSFSMALTEKDCRDRVNNAMYNSDKLGGKDSDAYRWAQHAANECFKEMAKERSLGESNSKEGSGFGWIFFIGFMALVYWYWYRPDVNGWAIPFLGTAAEREFKEHQKNRTPEEKEKDLKNEEEQRKINQIKRDIKFDLPYMTIAEVAERTGQSKYITVMQMVVDKQACKDFKELSTCTVDELAELMDAGRWRVISLLDRFGWTCKDYDGGKQKIIVEKPEESNETKNPTPSSGDKKNNSKTISANDAVDEKISPELKRVVNTKAFKVWHDSSVACDIKRHDVVRLYLGLREVDKLAKKNNNESYDILLEMILMDWEVAAEKGGISVDRWMSINYRKVISGFNDDTEDPIPLEDLISAFEAGFNKYAPT